MASFLSDNQIKQAVVENELAYIDELDYRDGYSFRDMIQASIDKDPKAWDKMLKNTPFITGGKRESIVEEVMTNPDYEDLKVVAHTCGEELPDFEKKVKTGQKLSGKDGGPVIFVLENEKKHEVTFVFRGTNSLEWNDNAEAFSNESSVLQEHALKFFEKIMEEKGYAKKGYNIKLSGHSKGGNKAQYVAIKSKYRVDECLNLDGQGFSKEFICNNKDLIKEKSNVITTLAVDLDYVSALGENIASEIRFFDTNQPDINHNNNSLIQVGSTVLSKSDITNMPIAHSASSFLHIENGKLELNSEVANRKLIPTELSNISHEVMMDSSSPDKEKIFYSIMGIIQSGFCQKLEKQPIMGKQQLYSVKQIKEGLSVLKEVNEKMYDLKSVADGLDKLTSEAIDENQYKTALVFHFGKIAVGMADQIYKTTLKVKNKKFLQESKDNLTDLKDKGERLIKSAENKFEKGDKQILTKELKEEKAFLKDTKKLEENISIDVNGVKEKKPNKIEEKEETNADNLYDSSEQFVQKYKDSVEKYVNKTEDVDNQLAEKGRKLMEKANNSVQEVGTNVSAKIENNLKRAENDNTTKLVYDDNNEQKINTNEKSNINVKGEKNDSIKRTSLREKVASNQKIVLKKDNENKEKSHLAQAREMEIV